jgi:Lysylphosphatidylglycerol synthase TM region
MSPQGAGRLGASAISIAKKVGPYLFAAAALYWVSRHTDWDKLGKAFASAPIGAFIAVSALMLVVNCAADTFAMSAVFARFGCHVRYKDLYLVRASTYLLAIVNYHVGQAAIVGYLYRVKKVPLLRASGWILFIIGINVGTLLLLSSAGAARTAGQENLRPLRYIPLACGIGIVAYAALLTWKPRILADRALFKPLFEMGIPGHIMGVLVRLPHIGVLLLWHFVSLRMFGVRVPVSAALLYLPVYFAAQSLPLNVNGIGIAQPVAIAFFAPFTGTPGALDPEAVTAYSLATSVISLFLQVILGTICLRWATAIGLKPQPIEPILDVDAPAASVPAQTAEGA